MTPVLCEASRAGERKAGSGEVLTVRGTWSHGLDVGYQWTRGEVPGVCFQQQEGFRDLNTVGIFAC